MWSGLCTTLVLQSRWESSSMHFTYFSSFLIALGFNWNVTSDPAARNRQITRYCHNSGPFVIFLSVPRFHPYIVFPIPPMPPPRPERFFVGWGGGAHYRCSANGSRPRFIECIHEKPLQHTNLRQHFSRVSSYWFCFQFYPVRARLF